MTQVKVFSLLTPHKDKFEDQVNTFLEVNKDKMNVVNVKYTACMPNPNNSEWIAWTAMVIFEPK